MIGEMYVDKMNEVSFQKLSEYATSPCVVDKVLLVDNLSKTFFVGMGKGVIVSDFIALLFCTEGNLEIDMDGKHYQLHKGDILFCSQGVALCNIILSLISPLRVSSCLVSILSVLMKRV